jgi:alcohol dehydrogenase (cytochrome c)
MIFEDLVLIGPAGSENGISGWVGAFRLSDGSPVWRFKTVPGAGQPDSESWRNPKGIHLGGGAVWTPFSLDVERAELYVAVTNPAPDLPAHLRPGNNLYTNSLVALDVRTGELRWYKQFVPSDSHDWDFTQVSPLFDLTIGDQNRSLVAATGKDGLLRALDRRSHETLYETAVTTRENVDAPVATTPTRACPGVFGGVEWNGPAYNPVTRMLYTPAVDWCSTFRADDEVEHVLGALYMGGVVQMDANSRGWITAVDAASGQVRWRYESAEPMVAAVTTTAGGLVFSGELTGDFVALDARSGEVLYRFQTGGPIGAGIVSYQVAGKQYVAVLSGRPSRFWQGKNPGSPTVLVFTLP